MGWSEVGEGEVVVMAKWNREKNQVDVYEVAVAAAAARHDRMNALSSRVGSPSFEWELPVGRPVRVEASMLPAHAVRGLHPSTLVEVHPDGTVEPVPDRFAEDPNKREDAIS